MARDRRRLAADPRATIAAPFRKPGGTWRGTPAASGPACTTRSLRRGIDGSPRRRGKETIEIIDQWTAPSRISARSWAAGAAIVSGLAWLVWELGGRVWEDNTSETYCSTSADYLTDTAFAVATTSTAIALLFISAMLRGRTRWVALAGSAGVAAGGFGNAVEHCVAEPFFLIFVAGLTTYLLATLVLAITLLLTGALGRWLGLCLLGTALGLMLGFDRSGAAVTGVAWLAAGASLALARASRASI